MGRKKKKHLKPWCWYCNREFDDEKVLIQHQKAKHFKCTICGKKLFTIPGLTIHCSQVHKQKIDKIPNALPNRTCIDIEIYGMQGIPAVDLKQHEMEKLGMSEEEPKNKVKKTESTTSGSFPLPTPMFIPPVPPFTFNPSLAPGRSTSQPVAVGMPSAKVQKLESQVLVPSYSKAIFHNEVSKVPQSLTNTNGMTLILKHPVEDVSLEERKANMFRYKGYLVVNIPKASECNGPLPGVLNGPFSTPPPSRPPGFPFSMELAPPPPPIPPVLPFAYIPPMRPPMAAAQITQPMRFLNPNPFFSGGKAL